MHFAVVVSPSIDCQAPGVRSFSERFRCARGVANGVRGRGRRKKWALNLTEKKGEGSKDPKG